MGLSAGSRTLNNQSGTCAGRAHRRGTCSATAGHRTWWVMGRVTASSLRSWALLALALPSRAKPRCSHRSLFRFHATCLLTWGGKRVSTSTRRYFLVLLQFKQGPDQKDCPVFVTYWACLLLQNCTVAQLLSKKGNPHVAIGALLEQSSFTDTLSSSRASNNSRVAPEYNAGFTGVLLPCSLLAPLLLHFRISQVRYASFACNLIVYCSLQLDLSAFNRPQ